jgi:methylated-DNA-[protein]-cysteine S-methyltransferase
MTATLTLFHDSLETPIGRLAFVADDAGRLRSVGFTDGHPRMEEALARRDRTLVAASNPFGFTVALRAYFDGALDAITGLPVAFEGTAFQVRVWEALRAIPCGTTWSYRDLARHIGQPTATRAVGAANGANPIGIVVPCHRVVGSDGSLTGFGGGIARKRWLLAHESRAGRTPELRFPVDKGAV